jgi:hypothetical protein
MTIEAQRMAARTRPIMTELLRTDLAYRLRMREKGDGWIDPEQDGEKVATGHGRTKFPRGAGTRIGRPEKAGGTARRPALSIVARNRFEWG